MGKVIMLFVVVVLLFAGPLPAQSLNATVTGRVTDTSKAVIPGVDIALTNKSTNGRYESRTNDTGDYSVPNLPAGTYEMEVEKPGFKTIIKSDLVLHVQNVVELNFEMGVGSTSETVTVVAEAPTVQLATSTIGDIVDSTSVRELPLNGRDWTQLATLQAGIVRITTQPSSSSGTTSRASRGYGNQLSDVGHRPNENNYRINGVTVNDYTNGGPGSVIGSALGVDAIQEFSVLTSNYSAEIGRTSGGAINAITKSGTNQFHGDAYFFLRDKIFDAMNFFDKSLPPFHRDQYGGSAGGPIRRNKTFIFGDYERVVQDKSYSFHDLVPSAAARAGNLCSIPTGVTPNCTPTTITVNSLVAPFLAFYPLPNSGLIGNGDTGVLNVSGLGHFTENYVTVRVDNRFSDKDSFAGSWFYDKGPFSEPDPLLDVLNGQSSFRQMASLAETHIFSPTLINTVTFGFNRAIGAANTPLAALTPVASDKSLAAVPGLYAPSLSIPGLTATNGGLGGAAQTHHVWNSFQAYDDLLLTRGTHAFKFGFAAEHMQYNMYSLSRSDSSFTFPSLQGFLLNQPTSVALSDPTSFKEAGSRQTAFGAYVQDDWRIRSNLTLNLGLRYEPTTLPTEAHNLFVVLSSLSGNYIPVNTLWQSNQTLKNFAPRVGFSWDPFKNGKTAVRGGFGIFDILPINWEYGNSSQGASWPFFFNEHISPLPPGSFPGGALATNGFSLTNSQAHYVEQNPPRNYAMNWNLNIQREITSTLTAMIGYVGSRTVHSLSTPDDMDMVLPTSTSAGYLWPFPVGSGKEYNTNVGTIRGTLWNSSSSYEGLQAQLTKKMGHGVQARVNYAWGKCYDYGSGANVGDEFANSLASTLFFDPVSRRGLCDFNVTHSAVANFVWDLPKPKFGGTVGAYFLGGWEASGILTVSTGSPFTLLIAGDPWGSKSTQFPYPDRLSTPGCANPVNPGNINNYVNLSCFTPPTAPASFAAMCQPAAASVAAQIPNTCMNLQGNSGRNKLTGPGLTEFDLSMLKNIPVKRISESFNIQFRAEAFNIFNHPNFQSPLDNETIFNQNGTPISGAGAIDATSTDSRQIQLGLKVVW